MTLYRCDLIKNACYLNNVYRMPTGIVVHSTGANNPNLQRYVQPLDNQTKGVSPSAAELKTLLGVNRYGNHWNQYYADGSNGRFACVNAFIGKLSDGRVATVQTLPWNMLSWGVGSGNKGSYNDTHIQFEVCEDGLVDRTYYEQAMTEAAELCAYLCEQYQIPTQNIVSHREAFLAGMGSNHGDIDTWLAKFGETMNDFRARVENARTKQKEDAPMTAEEKQAFTNLQAQFVAQQSKITAQQAEMEAQKNRIVALEEQVKVKWNYIDNNLPSWAVPTVDKLYNRNILRGSSSGLELSWLMLRILVILDRSGALDLAAEQARTEEVEK